MKTDECLHCHLLAEINRWTEDHAPRGADGDKEIDANEVLTNLAAVIIAVCKHLGDDREAALIWAFSQIASCAEKAGFAVTFEGKASPERTTAH